MTKREREPTDEQLERFVFAMLMGEARRRGVDIDAEWGARMVMRSPGLKQLWLERHRQLDVLAPPVGHGAFRATTDRPDAGLTERGHEEC